jgi:hypothetical protein
VQQLLRSEEPLDRFGALIELRDLIEGGDPRLADAAMQALRKLTTDDSRRVAAAAQRLLAEEEARAAAIAAGGAAPSTPVAVPSAATVADAPEPGVESTTAETIPTPSPPADGATVAAESAPQPAIQTTTVPWSLGRGAARTAIGSIVGSVFASVWYAVGQALSDSPVTADDYIPQAIGMGAATMFIAVAIVTVAESQVPRLRLPDGDAYRIVGGNRFAAAAVLGVIVALTVALFEYVISDKLYRYGVEVVFCFAIGFILAEVAVGNRFGGSRKDDVPVP